MKSITLFLQRVALFYIIYSPAIEAFTTVNRLVPQSRSSISHSSFHGQQFKLTQRKNVKTKSRNINGSTKLGMFLGSDGGILGVGAPEVVSV